MQNCDRGIIIFHSIHFVVIWSWPEDTTFYVITRARCHCLQNAFKTDIVCVGAIIHHSQIKMCTREYKMKSFRFHFNGLHSVAFNILCAMACLFSISIYAITRWIDGKTHRMDPQMEWTDEHISHKNMQTICEYRQTIFVSLRIYCSSEYSTESDPRKRARFICVVSYFFLVKFPFHH